LAGVEFIGEALAWALKLSSNVIKLFVSVIYKYLKKVEILDLGRPFRPTLMFAGNESLPE
jgi:hypothetical protein